MKKILISLLFSICYIGIYAQDNGYIKYRGELYTKNAFIVAIQKNPEVYISNERIKTKLQRPFIEAVFNEVVPGIRSGRFVINDDNTLTDKRGYYGNPQFNNKKFRKKHNLKYNPNDVGACIADYLLKLLQNMPATSKKTVTY